ncbi:hypothetical protein ACWKWU_15320 [Chitinophaga lutea]
MKMKQFVLPLVAMVMSVSAATAQTAKDVFDTNTKIVFLGADFTETRVVGDAAVKGDKLVESAFLYVNQKLVNDPKKFKVNDAFRRDMPTDIGPTCKRIEKMDPDKIKSYDSEDYQRLKPEDVATLVKGFDFAGKSGVGLLFVVEGMNKKNNEVSAYVTLVDMKGKKVLFTERMTGTFGKIEGFSYANSYLGALKDMIDEVNKKKYSQWKSTYGG